ncbi:MAG: DNA-directed RNA polymerase sigma-70 factor [Phycisphaeraceae bacterium]|nr:MAG: DNA-directed RNA polymerase sigma-70 factor [Phycisphaeraceae bacterium]
MTTLPAAMTDAPARGHAQGTAAQSERSVIDAAPRDPGAFSRLYRTHYRAVAGYLYRRTGDAALAEDLAAETFIAAWRALPRYRHRGVPFRSWLLRIATNQANAAARSVRPRRAAEQSASVPAHTQPCEADEQADAVHRAMHALTPEHQTAIALVYFESMTVAQAGAVLGVPAGTVKSRLARARDALRAELERLGATP